MVMTPPMRVSLQGSHRLRPSVVRHDVRRLNAAEHRADNDGCKLRECCDEFRLATAFGLIAAGAWNSSPVIPVRFLRSFTNRAG